MHRQDLEESEKVFECNLPLWLVSSLVNFRLAWYMFALSHTFNRLIILLHSSKVLGLEHPNALTSVSYLGWVLERQGKYEEAEAMHQLALKGVERFLGPELPGTYACLRLLPWGGSREAGQVQRGRSNASTSAGKKRERAWTRAPTHTYQRRLP